MISSKFAELLLKHQKMPSFEAIARELGINVATVKRHVKEMDFAERFSKFKLVSGKVMLNLFKQAATGKSHHHIRLWLELIEKLGEKKSIDITSKGEQLMIPVSKIEIVHTKDEGKQSSV